MLSFASSPGNIFNILGKCGALIKNAKSSQTTQQTALTDNTTGLKGQLNNPNYADVQAIVGNNWIGQLNNIGAMGSLSSNVAVQALNRAVFLDMPRLAQTWQQLALTTSLKELIRQMNIAGATVYAMTIGATPSAFTGVGNGVIVTSTRRPLDGLVLENSFAELLLLTCTGDSYSGTATAGNETFLLTGTGSENNPYAFDWPLGSNCQTQLQVINGNANNNQGNILTNSGFESWNVNTPNNFVIEVGTAGTQVFKESSVIYDGVAALRIQGDGATLTTLSQTFGVNTGTNGTLRPQTQYAVNLFLRRDGIAGTGTLIVELTDSTGIVIKDCNNVNNSFSIDLSTLTTNYASYSGVFRTPVSLVSNPKIRYRQSVAYTTGRSYYQDKCALGQMNQSTTSGIFAALFAGSIPFAIRDYGTINVTNSRGSGGTLSTFQTLFAQLFPAMISNEFLLPSSSSPSLSDNLIA